MLAEASRRLVEGNDTCMFATVLCGRIDVRSGHCTLANAGHDAPLLLHADGRRGNHRRRSRAAAGFRSQRRDFPLWHGQLQPGASLLAYTDGVTEAFDAGNQAFGSERLLAAVRPGCSAQRQLPAADRRGARASPGAAPQSDDITVLAIRLAPDGSATSARPSATTEESAHADTSDRPG